MSAYVKDLQTDTTSSSALTYSFSLTATPAATATLVLELIWNGTATISGVTDAKGNTWTNVAVDVDSFAGEVTRCSVWYTTQNTAALVSGDLITATYSAIGTTTQKISATRELSPGFLFDKFAVNHTAADSTSGTTGTTAVTTNATGIAICTFGLGVANASWTKDATYSLPTANLVNPAGRTLVSAYKDLVATGAQVATATFATSTSYASVISTFTKAATVASNRARRPSGAAAMLLQGELWLP